MKRVWIVVCTCTLALCSVGFADTPSPAPLSPEALAVILGPSAVSPACAARQGGSLAAGPNQRVEVATKSICNATANCASGTVSCNGNSICISVDRDCLNCEQGYVSCDGATTNCPTACNCSQFTGINRWCCQCACTGDCIACCRCDGGTLGQCAIQCG